MRISNPPKFYITSWFSLNNFINISGFELYDKNNIKIELTENMFSFNAYNDTVVASNIIGINSRSDLILHTQLLTISPEGAGI